MNLIQLLTFTWIAAWVIAESLFPGMIYKDKLQACLFSTFSIGFLNNVHGLVWRKIKEVVFKLNS